MRSLSHLDFEKGATLFVNKPRNWTSFDVVKKIKTMVRTKVGHAGTLDPLATGLLIICTGKFTKTLSQYQGLDKTYEGTITLGGTTRTYDSETTIDQRFPTDGITDDDILKATKAFLGRQMQVPPVFSAIKVAGQPMYKSAREGEALTPKAREITIHEFEVTKIDMPRVYFRIVCSKGTYVRSVAYDLGRALKNGAYLADLCRTQIGAYKLEDAWELEDLIDQIRNEKVAPE